MKKNLRFLLVSLVIFTILPLRAGERTIPVDIVIMIDKSLSMKETGKYDSLHEWVRNQLIGQMVIDGDWVTLYQFYGKADKLLTLDVNGEADRQKIIDTIDAIQPDGQYTDIGLAIDTIKTTVENRGNNSRHKIMLLLTDLKQEAPWTSRYAGTADNYNSPYLAEARILQHDNWYEITLDIDIQDKIVSASKELYSAIEKGEPGKDRDRILAEDSARAGQDKADGTGQTADSSGNAKRLANGKKAATNSARESTEGAPLPLPVLVVLSCVVAGGCIAAALVVRNGRKKKQEEKAA